MTETSRSEGVPSAWVSDDDFKAQLGALGFNLPLPRIGKWRTAGLMPTPHAETIYQDGKVFGSASWHPPSAALQALAIQRILGEKRDYDFARAVLWMAGGEVSEDYWRPHLAKADALLRRFHRWFRIQTRDRGETDDTFGDRAVEALGKLTGVLAKMKRRTPDGELPLVFNIGSQVIAGNFKGFATEPHDEGDLSELQLAEQLLDMQAAANHQIGGAQFNFIGGLSAAFAGIARSIDQFRLEDFTDDEIRSARNDVRNAFKIIVCHYEATKWIYGDEAFGLRMASWIPSAASVDDLFVWVVLFARLRRVSGHFYSSEEIASLAATAELNWLIATYFRDLQSNPQFTKSIDPKDWKLAFADSHGIRNLINEIAGCAFPKPDFRPWDQWKQFSGKTMAPGLLAMSIGAPNQVSAEAILHAVSGAPSP